MKVLKKLKPELLYDPAILGAYPKEKTLTRNICTPRIVTALFTIARLWKQPVCPSVDEWGRKM